MKTLLIITNVDWFLISHRLVLAKAAVSAGCPVIGSNVGGIPDIVTASYVHDKGSVEDLHRVLLEILENKDALYNDAVLNLEKAKAYLPHVLLALRKDFYNRMNQNISK